MVVAKFVACVFCTSGKVAILQKIANNHVDGPVIQLYEPIDDLPDIVPGEKFASVWLNQLPDQFQNIAICPMFVDALPEASSSA
jgi:hypothetical protein